MINTLRAFKAVRKAAFAALLAVIAFLPLSCEDENLASNGNVAVTGVSVKSALNLLVGGTETLSCTITPSNATNNAVIYKSSIPTIASITPSGLVTGLSAGTSFIEVTTVDGGKTAYCTVTVVQGSGGRIPVTGIALNKPSADLVIGETEPLYATVSPSNATNKDYSWSSSNDLIASVTTSGVVRGVAVGTATITVTTADGGKTANCTVNVSAASTVTNVTFNGVTADGSTTQTTTLLTLTFSQAVNGLSANDITLSNVSGISKGSLSSSGSTYTLPISGFTAGGTLNVGVTSPQGYNISGTPKTVVIYYYAPLTAVILNSVTADGSVTQTTTKLTLVFSQAVTGLSANDISLYGVAGLSKGSLSSSGAAYTLPISGFTAGGNLVVAVASPQGYSISGTPKTVVIYNTASTGSAALTITFAQINDAAPSIAGPTIYRSSSNGQTSKDITLDNASQYDGGSIKWYITGTTVTGTGPSYTLTTVNTIYSKVGQHFLTVEVMKGGIPYNKTIVFTVAE
jgi:uncharacterized protein YjdB